MKIVETCKNWYRNLLLSLLFSVDEALDTPVVDPTPHPHLTLNEASSLLGLAPATFAAYRLAGKILVDAIRVGDKVVYPYDQVVAAKAQQETKP